MGLFLELRDFLVDLVEVGEEELLAVVGLELGLFEFGRDAEQLLLEEVVLLFQLGYLL